MKKSILITFLFLFIFNNNITFSQTKWISLDNDDMQKMPEMVFQDNGINGITIDYTFYGAYCSNTKVDNNDYQFIHIQGFGKLGTVGKPALPMRNYPIAIPIGAEVHVEIISSQYKIFEDYVIHPAIEPASGAEEPQFVLDEEFYKKDIFYPEKLVSSGKINIMGGIHFTHIKFCPVQYNPATKELRVYSQIEVNITFSGGADFVDAKRYTRNSARVLKNFVINADNIKKPDTINMGGGSVGKIAAFGDSVNTIIISAETYTDAAHRLAYWNTRKGNRSTLQFIEYIGEGDNEPEDIKAYVDSTASIDPAYSCLSAAYHSAGIEYNLQDIDKPADGEEPQPEPENQPSPEEIQEFVTVTPNPSNPITTISYSIKNPSHVKLIIYSITGQKVATLVDKHMSAGSHKVIFNGSDFGSGVYLYKLESKGFNKTGKMLLMK